MQSMLTAGILRTFDKRQVACGTSGQLVVLRAVRAKGCIHRSGSEFLLIHVRKRCFCSYASAEGHTPPHLATN